MARDWTKTLWPASYKSASFWVEDDGEDGARRIVIHEFPMRDFPFLEDLGEGRRAFEVTAYVASDGADTEAASVIAACSTRGAGTLVLPAHGPILVRCLTFRRERRKDKAGYAALLLTFVREGVSTALISAPRLANSVFVQAEAAALAAANAFAAGLQVGASSTALVSSIAGGAVVGGPTAEGPYSPTMVSAPQPDYVIEAAVGGMQDAVIALEVVRTSEPVEAIASGLQRDAVQTLFDGVPQMFEQASTVSASAVTLVAIARALGDAMPPASAVRAFEAIVTAPAFQRVVVQGTIYPTPGRRAMAMNTEQVFRLLRLAALIAYCEAIARVPLSDRPAGITLRANVAEYFDTEMGEVGPAEIDLVHQIGDLRDATIAYLSRAILDLAPVNKLEANLSMPSLFWAWRLYQAPERSVELVARNKVVHPSFMPTQFEALAR